MNKRIIALFLAGTMMLGLASCKGKEPEETTTTETTTEATTTTTEATTESTTEPTSVSQETEPEVLDVAIQMDIIVDNYSLWLVEDDPNDYLYAVTDFNQDGWLEIVASSIQGSGLFTVAKIFEVNAEMELDEYHFPNEDIEGNFIPDIGEETLNYYVVDGVYTYVVNDVTRISAAEHNSDLYAMTLDPATKKVDFTLLASAATVIDEKGNDKSEFFDADKKPITEEEFNKYASDKYMPVCSASGFANIGWKTSQDMAKEDFEVCLHESWEAFAI